MRRELAGRRILITGASSGIGRALAIQLAQLGARLALLARREALLQELAGSLQAKSGDVAVFPGDVTIAADRAKVMEEVKQRFGGLDVLINNAGVASWAHFADTSPEILRHVMEVNFFGPAELIRLAVPLLAQGQQPAIVNVSSMCGRRAMPGWSEYSASKFALCGLSEALRAELALYNIATLIIVPGLTHSDFPRHLLQARGRAKIEFDKGMPPERVASGIINSLRKNKTETVLGREARWVLLCNKFFPRITDWLLARKIKAMYREG
jgi:short-subunit dehydrogenase